MSDGHSCLLAGSASTPVIDRDGSKCICRPRLPLRSCLVSFSNDDVALFHLSSQIAMPSKFLLLREVCLCKAPLSDLSPPPTATFFYGDRRRTQIRW
jgi:hypothetical protein